MILRKLSYWGRLIYQNRRQLIFYGLVWFAIYWLVTLLYWLTLDANGADVGLPANWAIARWLSVGHTLLLPVTYYWVAYVMHRAIMRQRWLLAVAQAVGMYIFIGIVTHFLYIAVGKAYLNVNTRLDNYYAVFKEAGPFYSITTQSIFIPNWWLYSILLTAVALKLSRDAFLIENRALRLEMNLLRAQINPHFLFNTLNNIYSLIEEKDAYAAEILLKFGDIMRYTLHETHTNFTSLTQEIDMLNEYIELERIRHGVSAPATITFDVSGEPRDFVVPPLLLITVVENAFKHGTQATIGSSWVRIQLHIDEQQMRFTVSNSKPPVLPNRPIRQKINVNRVGLDNIRRRLNLLYQGQHELTIIDKPDTYSITITLAKHGRSNLLLSR